MRGTHDTHRDQGGLGALWLAKTSIHSFLSAALCATNVHAVRAAARKVSAAALLGIGPGKYRPWWHTAVGAATSTGSASAARADTHKCRELDLPLADQREAVGFRGGAFLGAEIVPHQERCQVEHVLLRPEEPQRQAGSMHMSDKPRRDRLRAGGPRCTVRSPLVQAGAARCSGRREMQMCLAAGVRVLACARRKPRVSAASVVLDRPAGPPVRGAHCVNRRVSQHRLQITAPRAKLHCSRA